MVMMVGEREVRSPEERPRMMPPQCGVTEERVVVVVGVGDWDEFVRSRAGRRPQVRHHVASPRSIIEIRTHGQMRQPIQYSQHHTKATSIDTSTV